MPEYLKKIFEATGSYTSHLANQGTGKGQLNLIGYSYGSEAAAQEATVLTRNGVRVDHLVLIGSPISKDFLSSLQKNPLIGSVNVINLTKQGDPLYAGMPSWKVYVNLPVLIYQQLTDKGHFYYAPSTTDGNAHRGELAKTLYESGLR